MSEGQQLEAIGRLALLVHLLRDEAWNSPAEDAAQDKLHDACELFLREHGAQALAQGAATKGGA